MAPAAGTAAKRPGKETRVTTPGSTRPTAGERSADSVVAEAPAGGPGKAKKAVSRTRRCLSGSANGVVILAVAWFGYVGNKFRGILWPVFPEMDQKTHTHMPKHANIFKAGDSMHAKIWVGKTAWPTSKEPITEFDFLYDWDKFEPVSKTVNVSLLESELAKGEQLLLSTEVVHAASGRVVRAKGGLVKSIAKPEVRQRRKLLTGDICPEDVEPAFGSAAKIARGLPMMQVRLVFDTTAYPRPWAHGPWTPPIFVDEFWMTNDQLVKLNHTGTNRWGSEIHFQLMGVARHRFQQHMEASLEQNAKLWGEDSEEMLQMRDLFANTNPYLLAATLIVSILHTIFEFLAVKNDVEFFQDCDPETLSTYVSINSIIVGIFFQMLLLLYLWDESANFLVLIFSVLSIVVDMWKVWRAMKVTWGRVFGVLPCPMLESRVKKEKVDDFDSIAMKWLTLLLMPGIVGYSLYTLVYDCHRGWYSYFLFVSSSCVYSLGFVLMTPQVFINYKHKTVAFLPWRKFIYRAINTFIDDLFALIIRMPTMHRLSCFRDDIVFLVYLYQRQIYKIDTSRAFDEDGYAIAAPSAPAGEAAAIESKKAR